MNNTKDESIETEKMEIYPPAICQAVRNTLINNKDVELIIGIIVGFVLIVCVMIILSPTCVCVP